MGNVVFSELDVYLQKGNFYKSPNGDIYLVGADVPCISNKFACKITKDGDMEEIDAMYYRQKSSQFILLKNGIKIKREHKKYLQRLFCREYFQTLKQISKGMFGNGDRLPNVDRYLKN
jgi:hypothetical protein